MKKMIKAGRYEDARARRSTFTKKKDEYNARSEAASSKYREAQYNANSGLKKFIESNLAKYDLLDFAVSVDVWWRDELHVRIECNQNSKFDKALAWNYDLKYSTEKGVREESSSWSGLSATTPENLEELKQTVSAIEWIQSVNWGQMLKGTLDRQPDSKQFYKGLDELRKDPDLSLSYKDLEQEETEAFLADTVDKDEIVEVQNTFLQDAWTWRRNKTVFVKVIKETPKRFKVLPIIEQALAEGRVGEYVENHADWNEYWVAKTKLHLTDIDNPVVKTY